MPVILYCNMKRPLYVRDFSTHIQHHPVRMRANHNKSVRLRKINRRLIILLSRAKLCDELLR